MRKMLNKKGFSLVELMIVVVIMGILIAVAIPLYGNITKNAKNKACAHNIDTIENSAAIYMTEKGSAPTSLDQLTFEDGTPVCPWAEDLPKDTEYAGYTIEPADDDTDAVVKVVCGAQSAHQK